MRSVSKTLEKNIGRALMLAEEHGEPHAVIVATVGGKRLQQVCRLEWLDLDEAQQYAPVTLAIANPSGEVER